eukprot:SAG11_NODE_1203_length_5535_cov_13.559235_5_plen_60_part_00
MVRPSVVYLMAQRCCTRGIDRGPWSVVQIAVPRTGPQSRYPGPKRKPSGVDHEIDRRRP